MNEKQRLRANEIVHLKKRATEIIRQLDEKHSNVMIPSELIGDMFKGNGFKELFKDYIDDLDEEFKKL